MRIVFMGTPDFAVNSLERLVADGHEIVAVMTQPDRPAGRGKKLVAPPTKVAAQAHGLSVLQFKRVRDAEALEAVKALKPDVCVTAAFGQILNKAFLDIPKYGVINVHGSLLPKYRGAAPIQWAVINGETETGITTMLTDVGVDTGDILIQQRLEIGGEETGGELFERMAALGAGVLSDTLKALEADTLRRTKQDEALATHYPMLKKEMAKLDYALEPKRIVDLIRGTNPWPLAHTEFDGQVIRVHKAQVAEGSGAPGEILVADDKRGLIVAAGDGAVELITLQAPGSKAMSAKEFLRGRKLPVGGRFTA